MLTAELSKKCREFVVAHWGRQGLTHIKACPVTWVRHEANPHLKALRRRHKDVPLIRVRSEVNRIRLALSTEHEKRHHTES